MTIEDQVWDLTDSLYPKLKRALIAYDEAVKEEDEEQMNKLRELRSSLCYQIAISETFVDVLNKS